MRSMPHSFVIRLSERKELFNLSFLFHEISMLAIISVHDIAFEDRLAAWLLGLACVAPESRAV